MLAVDLIGRPFENGGRGPHGFDCWGLVREVYARRGVLLDDYRIDAMDFPAVGAEIDQQRVKWVEVAKPEPYCIVLIRFNSPSHPNHIGVCLDKNHFIHAREKAGVCIDRLDSPAWRHRIEGFYVRK